MLWIRSPTDLQNNYKVAFAILRSTEKRLLANTNHKEVYGKQIDDMLDRGAARRVTQKELANYKGPVFYLSHHAVMKPEVHLRKIQTTNADTTMYSPL